jgi:phosphoribosylaminoimidazole carboxylase PurE protein
MSEIQVGILMGSDSDLKTMAKAEEILKGFNVPYFITVASAHRTPARVIQLAKRAEAEGWQAIIAAAGMAAHLAGFLAAHTIIPIIGVPMDSSSLGGLDALLSTAQMPGGVPVACMGIGPAGAKNAALFVVEMLANSNPALKDKIRHYREEEIKRIEEKAARIELANENEKEDTFE